MIRKLSFFAALGACFFACAGLSHAQQNKGSAGSISAEMGGIAIGGDVTNSVINLGLTPEQLAALTRPWSELSDMQKKEITKLEAELKLNQDQIRAALEILGKRNVSTERLAPTLLAIAQGLKDFDTGELTDDVRKAFDLGKLDEADALLADIEKKQKRSVGRFAADAAETMAKRGQLALTQLRYREAAGHFGGAAAVLAAGGANEETRLGYLDKEADAFLRQGEEFDDNDALRSAIERYKRLLELRPRKRASADWATTQTNLGRALAMHGWLEMGVEGESKHVKDAIDAFREALKERTREHMPLEWAVTQSYLGNTLRMLGTFESGSERLDEAIIALREVLKENIRERAPVTWGKIQHRLGLALWQRGELDQAVAAFREASQELTRERGPLEWARNQFGLGIALTRLGDQEDNTARLKEAAETFRSAQQEWTHVRVPLLWAAAEGQLGIALTNLGKREEGTARLEEAVSAYRNALTELSQEHAALDWAYVNVEFGHTLVELAERESSTDRLKEAIAAYSNALKVYTPDRDQIGRWKQIATDQGVALRTLAERTHDLQTAKQVLALATTMLEANRNTLSVRDYEAARKGVISDYRSWLNRDVLRPTLRRTKPRTAVPPRLLERK